MLKLLEGLPDNVLGVTAEGKITGTDYEIVLIPAIEEKLKADKKIRMLYQLGSKFTGFELSAMLDVTLAFREEPSFLFILVVEKLENKSENNLFENV